MTTNTQPLSLLVTHALGAALPKSGEVPEWITLFNQVGDVRTRDGRAFKVDAARLMATFASESIDLPIDINHATDRAAETGCEAPAVGWGVEMRLQGAALQLRVDWLDEGKALLGARKYRYMSPSLQVDAKGNVHRIMAVALVTAPALAHQTALASAQPSQQETSMKTIALALGLAEGADEAACLSAVTGLTRKLETVVPKAVHDETVQQLAAANGELRTIRETTRAAKVEGVITAALSAKKILPAEKEHYVTLCASDDGLAAVEKLLAAKGELLGASGLDERKAPHGDDKLDAVTLAAKAKDIQTARQSAGMSISFAEAMTLATAG